MTANARVVLGLSAMAGFVGSGGASVAGGIGPITTLVLMAISLGAYTAALTQERGAAHSSTQAHRSSRCSTISQRADVSLG
ncbi:MAG: hypothetical protein HUU21_06655 [Polyangiaceae bacterium]|nr:hypothetical protein [Polyangiaceae bacterium]